MDNVILKNLEIGDKEFNFIKELIYKESAIKLSESKRALVQARLIKRIRELKIKSYREYCEFIKENYNDELIHLINCITTNKTEFFRESYHFDFLTSTVLPMYESTNKKKLRIWSAGCSTGEEPYTIAMTLVDYFGFNSSMDIKILATDIDTKVLQAAYEGIYSKDSFARMDEQLLSKYFLRGRGAKEGQYQAKEFIRNKIYFKRLNLLSEYYPMKGPFDIIFCRNVIIYFDKETQKELILKFHKYLDDDGYLFMGHSEALSGISKGFESAGRSIYRKE
jgi:chemotaxis protein methyltransferase CheR